VWAEGGRLMAGHVDKKGLHDEHMLFDFQPMRFESLGAPY